MPALALHEIHTRSVVSPTRSARAPRTPASFRNAPRLARHRHSQERCSPAATQAAGASGAAEPDSGNGALLRTLSLGALFAGWYGFNVIFNIFNKQVLTAFHFPFMITTYQFLIGSAVGLAWFLATRTKIDTSRETLLAVLPLAMVHTVGNLLTNVSLGMVAVSFTHTIKACEPLFSVLLSALFLGEGADPWVLATLIPIIGGVAGASFSEASFNWPGFISAMGSNITFQSRNVFSKKFMTPEIKEKVGGSIGLFTLMTMMSFCLLAPFAVLKEGLPFTPAAMVANGVLQPEVLMQKATVAALMFHLYQQVSYMILARVSPVTHSIGNCIKRILVIVASVVFLKNPMSVQSAACTGVALGGVFAYSQVKRIRGEQKKAAAAAAAGA